MALPIWVLPSSWFCSDVCHCPCQQSISRCLHSQRQCCWGRWVCMREGFKHFVHDKRSDAHSHPFESSGITMNRHSATKPSWIGGKLWPSWASCLSGLLNSKAEYQFWALTFCLFWSLLLTVILRKHRNKFFIFFLAALFAAPASGQKAWIVFFCCLDFGMEKSQYFYKISGRECTLAAPLFRIFRVYHQILALAVFYWESYM